MTKNKTVQEASNSTPKDNIYYSQSYDPVLERAKSDALISFIEAEATRQKLELLDSIGEPQFDDIALMQPDQYEGGVIINGWWKQQIAARRQSIIKGGE